MGRVNRTSNETDYYRFTLTDSDIGARTMRFELRDLTGDADLHLLNASGEYLRGSNRSGVNDESIVAALASPGTYYIRVNAEENGTIGYQLRYSNDSAVPGRHIESAFDLGDLTRVATVRTREGEVNRTRNETCLFSDRYYRFTLTDSDIGARTMRFELRDLTGDADLHLLNASGEYLRGSNRSGVNNESIVAALASPGTYYIRVIAEENGTIGYQLRYSNDSAVPGRHIESAFDLGDLTRVATVRTREGEVNRTRNETALFSDRYYRFTLTDPDIGARTMRVELRDLTGDADLYLLNASGEHLHRSRRSGVNNESIVAALASPGTYYIRVTAAENGTIGYQLRYGPDGS